MVVAADGALQPSDPERTSETLLTHLPITSIGYTDDLYAYYEANKHESFDDPDCHLIKAVDDNTRKLVAVSEWTFALDTVNQAEHEAVDPNAQPPKNWPVDGNWELRHFFTLNSEKWTNEHLKGQPHISRLLPTTLRSLN
jgi:hypothetical protein